MQLTYSTDGPVAITLRFARYDFTERRNTWEWTLHDKSGHATNSDVVIASAEDLRDDTNEDASAVEMLRSFLSFLGAWAEAQNYDGSENRDLFPSEKLLAVMDAGDWGEWSTRVACELFVDREGLVHVPAGPEDATADLIEATRELVASMGGASAGDDVYVDRETLDRAVDALARIPVS